ncbi:hypothetical protein GCM10023237_01280 [Streptomyces coeruleoprunus]
MSLSYRARVAALLADSPLTSEAVVTDVRDLLSHGEEALAIDTMCSWIYEDALPITREYHASLIVRLIKRRLSGRASFVLLPPRALAQPP